MKVTLSEQATKAANVFLPEWLQIQPEMDSNSLRVAIEVLTVTRDTPARFPGGKWATIQALQEQLEDDAEMALQKQRLEDSKIKF